MPQCLIPNCQNDAPYFLGIRLRRPANPMRDLAYGSAIWAPECEAYLCEEHASKGYIIDIHLAPIEIRTITTNTSAGGVVKTRTTPINHEPIE